MSIVLATDLGETSEHAADAAVALARRWNEPIILVHAAAASADPSASGMRPDLLPEALDAIGAEAERLESCGVRAEWRAEVGDPRHVVAEALAVAGDARILVVGTHARPAPVRWVIGSIAEALMEASPVPVLAVREAPTGLAAWGRRERVLRILLGVDADGAFDGALRMVRDLAAAGDCEIVLVNAAAPGFLAPPVLDAAPAMPVAGPLLDQPRAVEGRIRDLIARMPHAGPAVSGAKMVSTWGIAGSALSRMAEDDGFDLIAVGSRGPRGAWLGSTSRLVARRSHRPVLVARASGLDTVVETRPNA